MTRVKVKVNSWRVYKGWNYLGYYKKTGPLYGVGVLDIKQDKITVRLYFLEDNSWKNLGSATIPLGKEAKFSDGSKIKYVAPSIIDFEGYL